MKKLKLFCTLAVCLAITGMFCGSFINPIKTNAVVSVVKNPVISKTSTKISAPATIVKEIKNSNDLEESNISGVQIAIMDVNNQAQIVFSDDTSLSIIEAMNYISEKALPAFRFNTLEEGDALIAYLNQLTYANKITDLFFVCNDSSILKSEVIKYSMARGVLDYSGKDFSTPFTVSSETMKSFSSIAIVDADKIDVEKMEYFKDAYMSIWVKTEVTDAFNIMKIISNGVNGIISANQQTIIDCMNKINDISTIVRKVTVVGHRGASLDDISDPTTSTKIPENSMAAFKYAYENSADLIELDVMFSSDKELIIMHDNTINRTLDVVTAGDLYVSNLTKEQIQSYEYRGCNAEYKTERVPTLQDVLNEFKDKDLRILIEIKSDAAGLSKAVSDAVKNKNMQNQVSCISFYKSQLEIMKTEMPEIACGILTYTPLETTDNIINIPNNISTINSLLSGGKFAYAPNTGLYNANLFAQEIIRGVSFNGWTYVNAKTRNDHLGYGVSALTVDVPQWFNKKLAKINVSNEKMSVNIGEEAIIDIILKSYDGSDIAIDSTRLNPVIISGDAVEIQDGKIIASKTGVAVVVPRYQQSGYTVMGAPVEITVNNLDTKSSGCGSIANFTNIMLCIVFAGLVIVSTHKNRLNNKI
jgi:glycerophosphoryl diester phosphodiesterase